MTHLVKVVILLRFEQVEGLPLLLTGPGQQVVEHMVVPADTHRSQRVRGCKSSAFEGAAWLEFFLLGPWGGLVIFPDIIC